MREQLIGYLLDALEPAEREAVEAELATNRRLQADLELLQNSLEPLEADRADSSPPLGLAELTCRQVARDAGAEVCVASCLPSNGGLRLGQYRLVDWLVGAGVLAAGILLFIPAFQYSRNNSRTAVCQNNLRELWLAHSKYARQHGDRFPDLNVQGTLAGAGIYAPKLHDQGYLDQPQTVICPSAITATPVNFQIPSTQDVVQAMQSKVQPQRLAELQRRMGGSYGYHVGHLVDGQLQQTKNLSRPTFALMADAPNADMPQYQSLNHGGHGQNVLYEDGHVRYATSSDLQDDDDIYSNDNGQYAPGLHANDSVIGHSGLIPVVYTGISGK